MDAVLGETVWTIALVYPDHIAVLLRHLESTPSGYGWWPTDSGGCSQAEPEETSPRTTRSDLLGPVVNATGVRPGPEKVRACRITRSSQRQGDSGASSAWASTVEDS